MISYLRLSLSAYLREYCLISTQIIRSGFYRSNALLLKLTCYKLHRHLRLSTGQWWVAKLHFTRFRGPALFFPGLGRYFNFFLKTGQPRANRCSIPNLSLMKFLCTCCLLL